MTKEEYVSKLSLLRSKMKKNVKYPVSNKDLRHVTADRVLLWIRLEDLKGNRENWNKIMPLCNQVWQQVKGA